MPYTMPDEDAYDVPVYPFPDTSGNSTMVGGSPRGDNSLIGGDNLSNTIARIISASQYSGNMEDASQALKDALTRAGLLREGLAKDTRSFYDQTAGTLSNDVQAFLPFLDELTGGAARGEQYGQDLTKFAQGMTTQGLGRIDNGVADALARLTAGRDKSIADLRGIFDPAMARAGEEATYQRGLGNSLIDLLTKNAASLREKTDPMLASTAMRYQAPNQYTAEGIRGLLSRLALRGVEDAYDSTTESAVRQAVRSGTAAGPLLESLARQRARESETALLQAGKDSLGMADSLNQQRRTGEASNFSKIADTQRAQDALVPQGYDIASRGSLGAQGLVAQLAAAYGNAINQPNTNYMSNASDIAKTGINAGTQLLGQGMSTGARGFDLSTQSALQGDQTRSNLVNTLANNYFAGMRGASGSMFDAIRGGYLGEQGSNATIAPKQAATSATQAQADPWGVVAGQVAGNIGGKVIGKGVDWALDQIGSLF